MNSYFDLQDLEDKKQIFLNVHVSYKAASMNQMDSILIRIYVFHSMISDLILVLTNNESMIAGQEMVVNAVNFISRSIFFNRSEAKKDHLVLKIFKPKKGEKVSQKEYVFKGKHLVVKDLKMIFLFSYYGLYWSDYYINTDEVFRGFHSFFFYPQNAILTLFDIYNFETYKYIINLFNQVAQISTSTYQEILNKFQCIELSDICNKFLTFSYEKIENERQYKMAESIDGLYEEFSKKNENKKEVLDRIENDFNIHFPFYCDYMKKEIKKEMRKKRLKLLINEQQLTKVLNDVSIRYENEIKLKSKSKKYWTQDEIDAIVVNHRYLLQEAFYNAIHDAAGDEGCKELFQNYMYILSRHFLFHDGNISDMFKSDCDGKKNSNFMLKETESVKDVTATVEVNKDLKTVIEQDF